MRGRQCDPAFWECFNYNTSRSSRYREFLIRTFVNDSLPSMHTNRDVIERISRISQIPIESVPEELNRPVHPGGQVIFGFTGDEIDAVARDYEYMQWWVSPKGLNMAIVIPSSPPHVPTFDELMLDAYGACPPEGQFARTRMSIERRSAKYAFIDNALEAIAESRPITQEEVFQALQSRTKTIPWAEPFISAGGWLPGFQKDPASARSWLSKRWKALELPRFPRGPKRPKK